MRLYYRLPDVARVGSARVYDFIRGHGTVQEFSARSTIFHAGDFPEAVHAVESGLIRQGRTSTEGRLFTIGLIFPGEPFVFSDVINQVPHSVTAVTIADSRVWKMPAQMAINAIRDNHQLALDVLQMVSARLLQFHDQVENLGTLETPARIGQLLIRFASEVGELTSEGTILHLSLTHEEISHLAGATRPFTTTTLHHMEQMGLIRLSRKAIVIPDLQRLILYSSGHAAGGAPARSMAL